ncbi:hypothetical protein D3C73_745110 [compost metagenome]
MRQTVEGAGKGDGHRGLGQCGTQQFTFATEQQALQELPGGLFIGFVGRAPAALQLGFAQGLLLPLPHALRVVLEPGAIVTAQVQRPTAEQRLIQNQFIAGGGHQVIVAQRPRQRLPQRHLFGEPGATLTQHRQPGAGVFATFVIVGRGGEQVAGKYLLAF